MSAGQSAGKRNTASKKENDFLDEASVFSQRAV